MGNCLRQSVMTHESSLTLKPGCDRLLVILFPVIILMTVSGFVMSPASYMLKLLFIGITLLVVLLIKHVHRKLPDNPLILFPDGRVQWRDHSNHWCRGQIERQYWTINRYSVIRVRTENSILLMPISRSLQCRGTYRILMSWLRLRLGHVQTEQYHQY
jgi:hypothetical protein